MSKERTLLIVLFCGFSLLLWDGVVDHRWPDLTFEQWLIVVTGLLVISVVAMVIDSLIEAKRAHSDGSAPDTVGS